METELNFAPIKVTIDAITPNNGASRIIIDIPKEATIEQYFNMLNVLQRAAVIGYVDSLDEPLNLPCINDIVSNGSRTNPEG